MAMTAGSEVNMAGNDPVEYKRADMTMIPAMRVRALVLLNTWRAESLSPLPT